MIYCASSLTHWQGRGRGLSSKSLDKQIKGQLGTILLLKTGDTGEEILLVFSLSSVDELSLSGWWRLDGWERVEILHSTMGGLSVFKQSAEWDLCLPQSTLGSPWMWWGPEGNIWNLFSKLL